MRVRPLRPGELEAIDTVFAGLSPPSRHQRFHTGVVRLSDRTRRALADVDGVRHIALVAEVRAGRHWHPVGLTRLHETAAGRADVAIEVADAWQGCGVGRRLLADLRDVAVRAGYRELTASVLRYNRAAAGLLRSVFPDAVARLEDYEIEYVIPLPARPPAATLSSGDHHAYASA